MKTPRGLVVVALACAACTITTVVPVEVKVVGAPDLIVDLPAQLLLDVRACGRQTADPHPDPAVRRIEPHIGPAAA